MANKSSDQKPKDLIRDAWESLGIAFAFNQSGTRNADPEKTLLQTLCEFQNDRKMLTLVMGWLRDYRHLIHVERLKALANKLSASELAWLGGLASHQAEAGDARWKNLVQFVERKLGKPLPNFTSSRLDELQSERVGEDRFFKRFGLHVPRTEPADSKKLRPLSAGIMANIWLRMRALFGTNWRADTAVVLLHGVAKNAYQTERILGCSRETAYRNWRSLIEADAGSLLRGTLG